VLTTWKGTWPEEKDLKGKKEWVVFGGAFKSIKSEHES
jgi:hypothetical protein